MNARPIIGYERAAAELSESTRRIAEAMKLLHDSLGPLYTCTFCTRATEVYHGMGEPRSYCCHALARSDKRVRGNPVLNHYLAIERQLREEGK